jgi:hypothetical protein
MEKYSIEPGVSIERNVTSGNFRFLEVFRGFDKVRAVQEIFGSKTSDFLSKLKVEVFPRKGYMGVSDEDGHVFASEWYIKEGEEWSVYLDAVHELVHVRQFQEGKELFDGKYKYVDRPTEIEAYLHTVKEARRIGLSDREIFNYLEVPWITRTEHLRLAATCGLDSSSFPEK